MDVAIMGAGLSGLSCAITLEQNGIVPKIFESRGQVGDRFVNAEALLSYLTYPVKDAIRHFSENYHILLKPISNINELVIYSKHEKAVITGHLGFTNIRGLEERSFENQLAEQVTSTIMFHSKHTYEELLQQYSHVILATGDASYAMKIQNFRKDLGSTIKGVTVEGKFERQKIYVWMDYDLTPKGYGYLIPFSDTVGNIVISIPDQPIDLQQNWEAFFHRVSTDLNQVFRITDQFEIENYMIGQSEYPRIGNTFFTGNCLGTIMPYLGFGQFSSLLSGIYAAYDILGQGKYEDYVKSIQKSYKHSLVLRRALEKIDNDSIDMLVKNLNGFWGDRLFNAKSYNPLKLTSMLIRPFVQLQKQR